MDDEPFIPYMLMRGTIGMAFIGPDGNRHYYNPDPAGYRDLPPDSGVQLIGGDALIDAYDDGDAIIDDDGFAYLRE